MGIRSLALFCFLSFTMFSVACRAFINPISQGMRSPFARSMSNSASDGTIVEICRKKISDALGTDNVKVQGAFDDPNGSHVSIEVVSDKFEGKRAVQRQQMVYKALWEELKGPVHAVDSMICKTPDEAK